MVKEYFEAVTAPLLQEEQTSATHDKEGTSMHCGDAAHMDWGQMMIFNAVEPSFWSSNYNQDGARDDGTRSCPTNTGSSSYYSESPIIMCLD
ncbi:UNVERIFIED_CONTAM: hypothetical protein Sradi_0746300 [Sesamum radiatum]|uniref:Uncharacterized protein n=1 Tax=Sesamum radiatum TaxID=300843 RepID=A0AAW2VPI3_SESRA